MKREPAKKSQVNNVQTVKGSIDWMLVVIVGVLLIFGLVMLYSASSYEAQIKFENPAYYLFKQLRSTGIGIVVMVIIIFIPQKFWQKVSILIYLVAVISIVLVRTPLGININGAYRWLDFGFTTVQPAEIMKVALILTMAYMLTKMQEIMDDWKAYLIVFAFCFIAVVLTVLITDDLGTGIIIFAMGIIMIFVASKRVRYLVLTILVSAGAVIAYALIKPTKRTRILAWLHLEDYSNDIGYQVTQALYAIGSGGIFGKGLGKSTQKLGFVPESENDMIFSIICEELGIIGGIVLIALVALLIWRMKKIYDNTSDTFNKIVVAGVAGHISIQTFLNIAVVTNLLPNTGVPLPFISYGGSAIIFLLMEIGMVLAISRDRPATLSEKRKTYLDQDKERDVTYYQ